MRNLKRALSLGLTAAMISGLMVMGSSAASYADVTSEQNQEAIEVLKSVGIMTGDDKGNFNPDQNVTRNEMAVVMSNLMAYNVATYKNTSPFTDVPSWAEPYVAACWTNGITAGTSATTYGGNDTVTTAQAALMVMKALGYFQYGSDFGSDWQLATVSQGNKIDLFEDVDSGVREAMTRNDVAQLVLNALEAGTVEAESDGSFQIGDVSFASGVKYNYVTSNRDYASAISAKEATSSSSDTKGYIVELGEKLYQGDLTRENFVEDDYTDEFGRPASHWEYQADEIGTFADKADYVFTAKVTSKALYNAIGKTAAEYKNWDVSINGESVAYTGETLMDNKSDDDKCFLEYEGVDLPHSTDTYTGNGVVTEVYVDGTNRTVDIAVINYYAAEVLDVDEDDGTITLSSFYGPATTRDEYTTADFAEDDIVMYSFSNLSEEIEDVYAAEEMTGEVTRVRTDSANHQPTDGDYFVVDGTTYNYNKTMDADDRLVTENVDNDVVAYLDANGYVAYIDESAMTYDYAYVLSMGTESDQYGGGDKATVYARLILTDGTMVKAETDASEGQIDELLNHIVSYSVDKDGVYSLDDKSNVNIYGSKTYPANPKDLDSFDDSFNKENYVGLKIENGKASMTVDGATVTANANTVFVVVDTDDRYADYDITVYTGIKNVPDIDGQDGTQAIVAKDKNNSSVAKVVYIEDADVSGAQSVIFARADGNAKFVKDSEIGDYYEIEAVVDGATTTLMVKATATNAVNTLVDGPKHVVALKSITENDDGLVTSIKTYETSEVDKDTYYVVMTGTLAEEKDTVGIGLVKDGTDKYYAYSDDVVVARYNYKNEFEVSRISSIKNDANDKVVAVLDENVLIGICIIEKDGMENENQAAEASKDTSLASVFVKGVEAKADGNTYTVTLPASKNVDGDTTKVVATPNDKKATVNYFVNGTAWDEQANGDKKFGNDATITIKVTAENDSTATYTLKVTVLEDSNAELKSSNDNATISDKTITIKKDTNPTVADLYSVLSIVNDESKTATFKIVNSWGTELSTTSTEKVATGMKVILTRDNSTEGTVEYEITVAEA